MKSYYLLILSLFLASCKQSMHVSNQQTLYEVGSSVVSIEPTGETVSLGLAGYGAPPLGRFTITWDDKGVLEGIAMCNVDEAIYAATPNGDIYLIDTEELQKNKKVGSLPDVKFMAGLNGLLYAVDNEGNLWVSNPKSGLRWKRIGSVQGVTAFTGSDENLYVFTAENELLMGMVNGETISWISIGKGPNIISLAGDHQRIYAVTEDNFLLQRRVKRQNEDWQRIGYNNGDTYTIDVKQIVRTKERLYAIASDRLYASHHHTEGKLSVRSMAVKKDADVAVIVSLDVCGLDHSFTQSIRKEMLERRDIPESSIMINSSHTHFAPTTQTWITWGIQNHYPDSLYLNNVVRKAVIRSIEEALDNVTPSYLSFGRDTTNIGFNRSLRGELSIYDNSVDVIQAVSPDGKNKTVLFLTGCHPVFTDQGSGHYSASPNFPGYAREILERTGVNNTLFLQGCAGDINPLKPFRTSGIDLAADVIRVLGKEMKPVNGNITHYIDSIGIPVHPWDKEKIEALREKNIKDVRQNIPGGCESSLPNREVRWSDIMLRHYDKGTMPKEMPVYIQTLNIGDWKLIGLSREATTGFGMAVRNIWPGQKVSVAAYTNDVASYLATDPHIGAKDYEGYGSFFWYGQPSPFPLGVFKTVVEAIEHNNR
ncbi:hypothetical protein [uncultured Proteiniphilum sp.]|uniref:hypothetical protein n=1 Tax=uncultured Proteiniphilum sp. TaxID=497637 RepID=UPI00262B346A|nr:hypothetical protein [uncultured Proteiniphilum sp.]